MYEDADVRFDIVLPIRFDDEEALAGGTYGSTPVMRPSGNFLVASLSPLNQRIKNEFMRKIQFC